MSSRTVPSGFLLVVATSCILAADWPTFRGNPAQTGVAKEALPEKLSQLWSIKTTGSIEGGAAIVGTVVYVGSTDGFVYALDLATGKELWKAKVGGVKAPVGYHDGRVYVGNDEGVFTCLDAKTGQEIWKMNTESEITSGPAFAGEDVLFGCGDEHLYCLYRADGKTKWKFQVPGGPVQGTPVIANGKTYAAGCDSKLHAINLNNGQELGTVELGGQVGASAAVVDGYLYLGTMTNQLLAIDLEKLEVAWTVAKRQPFYASAAVTEKHVVAGNRDRKVYLFDRPHGGQVWEFVTGGRIDGAPVVAGSRIYVGSFDKHLYVLDVATGKEVQKLTVDGAIVAAAAVAHGKLVIGTDKGTIYCFGNK
jgi:outer membrane protein assembly factor BamB